MIVERQKQGETWGQEAVECLSNDLRKEFLELEDFLHKTFGG